MTTPQEIQEQTERLILSAKDDPDTELWAAPHPVPQEWSAVDPEDTDAPEDEPQAPEAPDADPYGWVAAVEDGRPTVKTSAGDKVEVRPHHVVVWTHGFPEPDKFDHAVAQVLPNGALLVTLPGRNVPLKGYAPGAWLTFEHVGPEYQELPKKPYLLDRAKAKDMTMGAAYGGGPVLADQSDDGFTPQEREAWKRRQAAEDQAKSEMYRKSAQRRAANDDLVAAALGAASDTQNLPKVETATEGGGAQAPKAPGARVGRTDRTPRPGTGVPEDDEEKTPGPLRALWRSLVGVDWPKD